MQNVSAYNSICYDNDSLDILEVMPNGIFNVYNTVVDCLLAYYSLGYGSSAKAFADSTLVTVANMTKNIKSDYIKNIVNDEYIANVLKYDQLDDERKFFNGKYAAGSINADDDSGIFDIADNDFEIILLPNPVRSSTIINFYSLSVSMYDIKIYDASGHLVQSINNVYFDKGEVAYTLALGNNMPSGSYHVHINSDKHSATVMFVME